MEPAVKAERQKRKLKVTDIIFIVVILVVIIALLITLTGKLHLKSEVSAARKITDRLITDISKVNGTDAKSLGTPQFQSQNSASNLNTQFEAVNTHTNGSASVVRQTVDHKSKPDTVFIIYKYGGKTPYYIRVAAAQSNGAWHLVSLLGSANETKLIVK